MQLRRKAQLHSADEAAIVDSDGRLVEGALSAIVWWRGDVLCAPDHQTRWLESVTRNEVFELAKSLGYQTRVENVKPADLVGCEVWALSSLQGIRAVTDWVNLGSPVGAPARAEKFQKRLRMLATAI
jgi:branched-subunit amino acid aminotransferase/4-amino-4-deoxychorismate lyase